MNAIFKLYEKLTSHGKITIVQKGFLYSDTVNTREQEITFKDFVIILRYLLKNKYLKISFHIEGKDNADSIIEDLKNIGVSMDLLRNELFWITELDRYEIDFVLSIGLSEERRKELIETFYRVYDAVLVHPVGYISWEEYFKNNPHLV